jgi:hypothetical protein
MPHIKTAVTIREDRWRWLKSHPSINASGLLGEAIDRLMEGECEAIHSCAICGRTISSKEYEEKGCIYCGADSEN